MILGKVEKSARDTGQGTVSYVIDGLTHISRYIHVEELNLKEGDMVLGEVYPGYFGVIKLAPPPAPLYKVEFQNKRYAIQSPDGQVSGWYRSKRQEGKRIYGSFRSNPS